RRAVPHFAGHGFVAEVRAERGQRDRRENVPVARASEAPGAALERAAPRLRAALADRLAEELQRRARAAHADPRLVHEARIVGDQHALLVALGLLDARG